MAEKTLFPVFDVPEIIAPAAAEERKYKPSVYFDFEAGDFRRDGANKMTEADGREAYCQWCMKTAMTERFEFLAYSTDIGVEMYDALNQADRAAVESAIERTINEALMINPKTEYVRDFEFTWEGEDLDCGFTVKGRDWEEFRLTVPIISQQKEVG